MKKKLKKINKKRRIKDIFLADKKITLISFICSVIFSIVSLFMFPADFLSGIVIFLVSFVLFFIVLFIVLHIVKWLIEFFTSLGRK